MSLNICFIHYVCGITPGPEQIHNPGIRHLRHELLFPDNGLSYLLLVSTSV